MSAYKARQVLDLVRGKDVDRAAEILRSTPREGARVVAKVLASAVANARNNDLLDPDDLFVSACYADEGTTIKRWRPRARGRATRIRKRTCHITVIVSRLPEDRLERRRARQAVQTTAGRSRRVAASRRSSGAVTDEQAPAHDADVDAVDATTDIDLTADGGSGDDVDAAEDETTGDDADEDDEAQADEGPSDEAESNTEVQAEAEDVGASGADDEEKD
jgi:large subunit ribosomal protein L22